MTEWCVLTLEPCKQVIEGHMTDMSLIGWSTNKLQRVARISLSAEIGDELFAARLL